MRIIWASITALLLVSTTAMADICKDEAKKRLTYLALDAFWDFEPREYSDAAIEQYRYVVDNAQSRLDKRAAYLSCRNLTAMLHHAGLLDERPELLEGCDEKAVNSFLNSLMPAEASSQGWSEDDPQVEGIAPGDWLPIVRVAPVYPGNMLAQGVNGVVLVEFGISRDGRVVAPRVVISSDKRFEKAAIKAVKKFRYKPRVINSEPVEATGVLTSIRFYTDDNDALYTTHPKCAAREES